MSYKSVSCLWGSWRWERGYQRYKQGIFTLKWKRGKTTTHGNKPKVTYSELIWQLITMSRPPLIYCLHTSVAAVNESMTFLSCVTLVAKDISAELPRPMCNFLFLVSDCIHCWMLLNSAGLNHLFNFTVLMIMSKTQHINSFVLVRIIIFTFIFYCNLCLNNRISVSNRRSSWFVPSWQTLSCCKILASENRASSSQVLWCKVKRGVSGKVLFDKKQYI